MMSPPEFHDGVVTAMTVDHAHLRRGTIIMIIAGVGGYLSDYALNLGVARLLELHDYGDFKIAMAFLNLSALAVLLGAASTTVHVIVLAQTTSVGLLSPLITRAIKEGPDATRDLHTRGFRLLLCLAIPAAVGLIVFAPWILTLFGPDYVVATPALAILTVGYLVSTVLALLAIWLQYSGNERCVMWIMLSVLFVNIVLNVVLIPIYGINGAAAGTTVVLAGSALILSMMMRRYVGVSPWPVGAVLRSLVRPKER